MRFNLGPVPEDPAFRPGEEGWRKLREPKPWTMQLFALPLGLATTLLLLEAWSHATPARVASQVLVRSPLLPVLLFLGVVPAHELLHAVVHPGAGRSRATIFGFWPSKLLFYAHYDDAMGRDRLLVILLTPLAALSLLPLLVCAALQVGGVVPMAVSLINGLAACGDLLGALLVAAQVPSGAFVRNQGYYTWWKHAHGGPVCPS